MPVLTITFKPDDTQLAMRPVLIPQHQVAIILDGEVLTTSVVAEPTSGQQVTMEGWSTLESAEDLAVVLNSDPLPVPFEVASFEPL